MIDAGSTESSGGPARPLVSVVVCTKDRPTELVRAVRSVLLSRDVTLDVIVVDQSDGDESEVVLGLLIGSGAVRYHRSRTRGKGAALNEGLRLARSDAVACTDDDCEVTPDWVAGITSELRVGDRIAVAFSDVLALPYDSTAGYVPTHEGRRSRTCRRLVSTFPRTGIGAGMAVRRDAVLSQGGFDASMGPGAHFPAAEDWDLSVRMLLSGWEIRETVDVAVIHHGFRTFTEGRGHARRDWVAIGAVAGKTLRSRHPLAALYLVVSQLGSAAVWPPLRDVLKGRRPRGWQRIAGFCEGFVDALRFEVDRSTMTFELAPVQELGGAVDESTAAGRPSVRPVRRSASGR